MTRSETGGLEKVIKTARPGQLAKVLGRRAIGTSDNQCIVLYLPQNIAGDENRFDANNPIRPIERIW
jgi:hypothetical protein